MQGRIGRPLTTARTRNSRALRQQEIHHVLGPERDDFPGNLDRFAGAPWLSLKAVATKNPQQELSGWFDLQVPTSTAPTSPRAGEDLKILGVVVSQCRAYQS